MTEPKNNVLEAYKMVIDYNKVVISLASTILAGQIAFLVFQETPFIWTNYFSSLFLVITIILSLIGFGKSILTIKTEISNAKAILFTNLSVCAMILGIALIGAIQPEQEQSLDKILKDISTTTSSLEKGLTPQNCMKIIFSKDIYTIDYSDFKGKTKVIYSTRKNKIVSIE
ncbi:hypothetical protein MM239_06075 [Belliella sp. DSM 111904]|uniref:Uncharacterized protein n=1 Tax=Belliella filtrata TaxID=2923435 RepID=A0ABS9UYW9_9BACT|nr:hypothetical protein [Belliella filtrata]MCH7408953.1 hypothetical protein [Belliella filtrata]